MITADRGHKKTRIIYRFITLLYMGIIFYLSSMEMSSLPELPRNFDKVLHTAEFAILAFLIFCSIKSMVKRNVFLLSFVIAAAYGITDELHQIYVPGRYASLADLAADSLGAFLGAGLAALITGNDHS